LRGKKAGEGTKNMNITGKGKAGFLISPLTIGKMPLEPKEKKGKLGVLVGEDRKTKGRKRENYRRVIQRPGMKHVKGGVIKGEGREKKKKNFLRGPKSRIGGKIKGGVKYKLGL